MYIVPLNYSIFDMADFPMIDIIGILQDSKSRDFGRNAGKESYWLLCVIACHQELVIEL